MVLAVTLAVVEPMAVAPETGDTPLTAIWIGWMDEWMDGWMGGRRVGGRADGRTDGRMNEWMDVRLLKGAPHGTTWRLTGLKAEKIDQGQMDLQTTWLQPKIPNTITQN